MGWPRVSLGGVQVRMRQSLFTFRHRTFRGEPGAPGFSAAASETQSRGWEEGKRKVPHLVSLWPRTLPLPPSNHFGGTLQGSLVILRSSRT